MRTLFHVGHRKTGSTALQLALNASREGLIGRGVLYPSNAADQFSNHRLLFADLIKLKRLPRHITNHYPPETLGERRADIVEVIRAEVAAHRPECMVLSSETRFSNFDAGQRRAFLARMEEIGAPGAEIVAYIRRPSSLYLSQVQQTLKASHEVRRPFMLPLWDISLSLVEDFGRERTHLRAFDRRSLTGGDVIADFVASFLAQHGVGTSDLEEPKSGNVSSSAEGTDIVRRYRLDFHPDENDRFLRDGSQLNNTIGKVEVGLDLPRPRIRPDLAERIDYCRDDLLRLRDAYGLVVPDYDYGRVERGELTTLPKGPITLDRIAAIDRDRQIEIVARLRETKWAGSEPRRMRWLEGLPVEIEAEGREAAARAHAGRRGSSPARDLTTARGASD